MPQSRAVSRAQLQIGSAFAALGMLVFAAVGLLASHHASRRVEQDLGANLTQVASRLSASLDVGLYERYREIQNFASIEPLVRQELVAARWRPVVDQLKASFPQYAWIGVADADDGAVLAATGGVLEGASVAKRPWFGEGRKGPFVGDVHDAVLLASLLSRSPTQEPLRLLDVAAPIRRGGQVVAVLGAHIDWAWVQERRQRVLGTVDAAHQVELRLLDAQGRDLLGAADAQLSAQGLADTLAKGHSIETWSDGRSYLTAAMRSAGYRDYAGLGWTVVARQPLDVALAPARALQRQILAIGLSGALSFGLFGWWLAGHLTAPLRRVAQQAQALMPEEWPPAPATARRSLDEVEQLSVTLGRLLTDLRARESDLRSLNQSLEARVQERTAALEVANEDLKGFSRSVSHDLKGPIATMGSVVREVLEGAHGLDEAARRTLRIVANECDRLRALVDELLLLAQVEQQTLVPAAVDMSALAAAAVADVLAQPQPIAGLQRSAPTVRIGSLPDAMGDSVLLRQIWHNLVANAVKFSARVAAPRIEISGEAVAHETVYCVRDNGAGFDTRQSHRLFAAFQRLHRASDYPGTGVGLSIVKRIVHRHGGRVWARSAPGEGAQFWFALPRLHPAQQALLDNRRDRAAT